MNRSLGWALVALAGAVAVVTVAVSVITGNPVATYVFNRNFAVGTATMVVGVMLIWHQRPDVEERAETGDADVSEESWP